MRISRLTFALLAYTPLVAGGAPAPELPSATPLVFEANHGQFDDSIRFVARASGQTIRVGPAAVDLVLRGASGPETVRLLFPGSASRWDWSADDPRPGRVNYFTGPAENWRTGIPLFSRIRARNIYEGIDAILYGNSRNLEYDFVVRPGADPSRIRIRLEGAAAPRLDDDGNLVVTTSAGDLLQQRPVAYQLASGRRTPVEVSYILLKSGEAGLRIGDYDPGRELVVDPVIRFSTYLGGTGFDEAFAIAVDAQGFIYVAGSTDSADFPATPGVFQPGTAFFQLPGDAFVTKLRPDGTGVVFSTYLGGNMRDQAQGLAVDAAGNVYVAGTTESSTFPTTPGAYQLFNRSRQTYSDGFVAKLSPDGSTLLYSTYLGDDFSDYVYAIAVDGTGSAHVAGASDSSFFPATGSAFQRTCPGLGAGAFATKLDPAGGSLLYSTRLCGDGNDVAYSITLDAQGNAYVAGVTDSSDFPVSATALRSQTNGSDDAFAAKISPDGQTLVYSTYLGGAAKDEAYGVAVDAAGNAYVGGHTESADFPATAGSHQPRHADSGISADAFVAALNADGSALRYATFLGGTGQDRASAIAVGGDGSAYVTGVTGSPDFPVAFPACQTGFGGGADAFITKLSPDGGSLRYSLFAGGRGGDAGAAIAVDGGGAAHVAGLTGSANFPTTEGAFRTAYGSGYQGATDAFVLKIAESDAPSAPCVAINGLVNAASFLAGPVAPGEIVSIFGAGLGPASAVLFDLNGGDVLPKEIAGTRVLFDGAPATLIATSSGQVNAIVPYAVAGRQQTMVQVEYLGSRTAPFTIPVTGSAPAMFTQNSSGAGPGAILNQDFSLNTPGNRAARGSIVQIFATGEGQTSPGGIDGKVVAVSLLPVPLLPVSVTIGGLDAPVHYAGGAPGNTAGLVQINAQVPDGIPAGSATPVVITIGGRASAPGVTLAVQ